MCVRNIRTKNYQNLLIGFQVTIGDVGDTFWDTVYRVRQKKVAPKVFCCFLSSRLAF